MTQIQQQIDSLVRALKRSPQLSEVRFVRGFQSRASEMPVAGFLATVTLGTTAKTQGFLGTQAREGVRGALYCAEAEIRVYAPASENGSGLSRIVGEMLRELECADEEHILTHAEACSIEFDADLNAIFRRLRFGVEFCLCEEGTA